MIDLPPQLQNPAFRFLLLKASEENGEDGKPLGKSPLAGVSWKKNLFTFDQLPEAMKRFPQVAQNRVGIACGYGGLCVVDADKKGKDFEALLAALQKLPQTFTVSTPNGGRHFYFICPEAQNTVLPEGNGEIRGEGYYVVAAGSELQGKKYRVVE